MNDLQTTEMPSRAAPQHVAAVTTELWGSLEQSDRSMKRLPSAEERNFLTDRSRAVAGHLRPIEMASEEKLRAGGALSRMFGNSWPNFKPEKPVQFLNEFVDAVKSLPLFAILEAIEDFKHGRIKQHSLGDGKFAKVDPQFPPPAPLFFQIAENKTTSLYVEQSRLRQILAITKARVDVFAKRSPEDQAAADQKIGEWRAESASRKAAEELADRAKRKVEGKEARQRSNAAIEAEYKSLGIEPIRGAANQIVSPSLMRALGRGHELQRPDAGPYRKE